MTETIYKACDEHHQKCATCNIDLCKPFMQEVGHSIRLESVAVPYHPLLINKNYT